MSTKFKTGDKVLHNGEELEVEVSRKNFSNQSIIYKLSNGEQVEEKDLNPIKGKITRTKKKPPTKDEELLKERLELLADFQEIIEADEDFNEDEFFKILEKMTKKQFEKFQEDLLEKALED